MTLEANLHGYVTENICCERIREAKLFAFFVIFARSLPGSPSLAFNEWCPIHSRAKSMPSYLSFTWH
jgi:hypothetical protein